MEKKQEIKTDPRKQIGEVIKMLRIAKKKNQEDIAKGLKISLKHYNIIENGGGGSFETTMTVLNYYGCKLEIKTPQISLSFKI